MHLSLVVIAMVTAAQFFQKVDSRGSANDRLNYNRSSTETFKYWSLLILKVESSTPYFQISVSDTGHSIHFMERHKVRFSCWTHEAGTCSLLRGIVLQALVACFEVLFCRHCSLFRGTVLQGLWITTRKAQGWSDIGNLRHVYHLVARKEILDSTLIYRMKNKQNSSL
jgi:hypothetical protein